MVVGRSINLGDGFDSERRHVTVLFADISDSTRLVKGVDPEDAVSLLSPTVELMAETVRHYDGTVVKTMGDGIMAIFGAPIALEKHATRACYAAIAMQAEVESRRKSPNNARSVDVRIHVGLATGEVVAGILGDNPEAGFDAAGFTIHLASYLQDLAPSGGTYLSESTFTLIKDQLTCEPLGPTKIRDNAERIPIYRLVVKGQDARPRQTAERRNGRPPLVGRDGELAALRNHLDALSDEGGRILSIVGEAGIGKSHLVAEFKATATQREFTWLEGAALSYGRSLSYWPFLEILRAFCGITDDDTQSDQWRKLERQVTPLFHNETPEILPYVATLLGVTVSGDLESRVKYLDGEAMRHQIFRSIRLLLEKLAGHAPVIMVFEDAFWMDLSSVSLLLHLMPLVESAPLLICLVTRGEFEGTKLWVAAREYERRYSEIYLEPLSSAESNHLIDNLLKTDNLPRNVRKAVMSVAEGNPLFLEEVIRTLVDTQVIVRGADGGWHVTGPGDLRLQIPDSIHSVIMARVDRLKESARQTLKTASVIGRAFFVRVLASILEPQLAVPENLAILRRADLIFDRRGEPEPECMFKHVLVQEATYESILIKGRRTLHAKVGDTLERLFADRLDEMAGLLAYHYARAELWERAHEFLLKAGDQADKVAADAEALQHFQDAMRAFERAFGHKESPIEQAVIQRKMGEALYRKGENEQAAKQFRLALELLGDRDPHTEVGVHLEIIRQVVIQVWHRLLPHRLWERRIGTASVADEERVRIFIMQWWLHFFENPQRTALYSLKTINESERRGVVSGIVHSSATLGFICDVLRMPSIGLYYHARADRLASTTKNPLLIGHAVLGLGWYSSYVGKWDAATDYFARGAILFRQVGDLRQWGSVTWGTILLLCYQGKLANAIDYTRDLLRSSEVSGDAVNLRWSRLSEGMTFQRVGRLPEAEVSLETAIEHGLAAADWQLWVRATAELVDVRLQQGRIDEANSLITAAVSTVARRGLMGHHATSVHNMAAATLLASLEKSQIGDVGRRQRRDAWRACRLALRGGRVFRGSLPHALRLRGTYAWLAHDPSSAEGWWNRSLAVSEELGAAYDTSLTYIEIGRRLGRAAELARGEAMLVDMRNGR
jgi:class 3 adenylate cyclase/tetratricopeptide (TPR) repeat protein